jgi:ABC-type lipoprotein export system ATPase subunit
MKLDTGTELPTEFKLTKEFLDFYNLIEETNQNLFITGKAGSGKSTLLEYFRQNTKKKPRNFSAHRNYCNQS